MANTQPTGTPDPTPTFDRWNMPDLCTTCSDRNHDDTIHHPHAFRNGTAHYRCQRGHRWTCGWACPPEGAQR